MKTKTPPKFDNRGIRCPIHFTPGKIIDVKNGRAVIGCHKCKGSSDAR